MNVLPSFLVIALLTYFIAMCTLSLDFITLVQHHTLGLDDIAVMCVGVCLPDAFHIFRAQCMLTTIRISSQKCKGVFTKMTFK